MNTEAGIAAAGAPPPVAAEAGRTPGQAAMWVFVLGDMFIFAGWFAFYMINRAQNTELFLESQRQLSQDFGAVNTLILLVSSWMIAVCVQASREGKYERARLCAIGAIAFGVFFVVSKVIEWSGKIGAGFTLETNDFFKFYYFLTGVHVFHVLIGFVALAIVIREVSTPRFRSQEVVETGATYWHMVDFLWVVIFALLYLMR